MEILATFSFNSTERIRHDNETMQPLFDQCNDNLTYLRKVFKRYQKKNERKLSDEEIRARSKTLDILRKQLNLLLEELELQD